MHVFSITPPKKMCVQLFSAVRVEWDPIQCDFDPECFSDANSVLSPLVSCECETSYGFAHRTHTLIDLMLQQGVESDNVIVT